MLVGQRVTNGKKTGTVIDLAANGFGILVKWDNGKQPGWQHIKNLTLA